MQRHLLRLAVPFLFAVGALWVALPAALGDGTTVLPVKIVAIGGFEGNLESVDHLDGRPVGGAAHLAAFVKERTVRHPNALVVGAGALVGGSPPISGLLGDVPTIRLMDELGMVVNVPGSLEFARGQEHFIFLSQGGCSSDFGCFDGAGFQQVSANIVVEATGEGLLPPFYVADVRGVPVGFVAASEAELPLHVFDGAVDGLTFLDPVESINLAVGELTARGVRTIVVLVRERGTLDARTGRLTGPLAAIVEQLDPAVDVVIGSSTTDTESPQGIAISHAGMLVVQVLHRGMAIGDIDLTVDLRSGEVTHAEAQVAPTYNDALPADPAAQAIVDEAREMVAPLVERVVGEAAFAITREVNPAGESALGNLSADAQRWRAGTHLAVVNPGGIRADLSPGPITLGHLLAVHPFGNQLIAMTLSGEQLYALFNQQWTQRPDGSEAYRPLQVSGVRVSWDGRRPLGDRVVAINLSDGQPIDRAAHYGIATNSFLAGGGDGFSALTEGGDRRIIGLELDALVDYVQQHPAAIATVIEGRITRVDAVD